MLFDSPVHPAFLVVLCFIPAAFRWWSGRVLIPLLDDPVLPERLVAHRRRNLVAIWPVVAAIAILGSMRDLFWAVPLIVLGRVVAGYPLRRALFNEPWSLPTYVLISSRLWIASSGFWLLLAAAPLIAGAAGTVDWIAALALGALLIVWNHWYADSFRWLVRTKPVPDGPLLARFKTVAAASRAPQPRFEVIGLGGGAMANAFALGSLRGSSVLYTDKLLQLLDTDEAAAITAHEIGHLEHFDPARLRRLYWATVALICGATSAALMPASLLIVAAFWSVIFVAALVWMARDRQQNETKSDLRAVELSGDPEALIRALTKLYTFSRVPRRWTTEMENSASHPSLARRIRSIREVAGTPQAPALPNPETVRGMDGKTTVTFEADRLHWQATEGVVHVLSYAHLTELRVSALAAGSTRLVALERGGQRWEAALEATEAARAQAILDRVDVRLAEPVPRPRTSSPLFQVAAAGVAISAMWAGQILVAVVALCASLRSVATFYAAAGGGALGAAGIVGRQALATGDMRSAWPALFLVAFGLALLAGAWRKPDAEGNRVVTLGMAGLALLVVLSLAMIAMRGGDAVGLNQASLAIPSAAVLPFALAAALICRPRRAWRFAAIPVALVGLMAGIAGSGTFLYAFGSDPFLVSGPAVRIEPLTGEPIADFTIPGMASDLRLSPGGRQIAVMRHTVAVGVVTNFSVGAPGSPLATLRANDLLFLDDERVVTLGVEGVDTVLREVVLQPQSVAWERRISNVQAPRLSYRSASGRWLLTGTTFDGRLVAVEPRPGSDDVQRREWDLPETQGWSDAWAIDGDTVLVAQKRFAFDGISWTILFMVDSMRTRLTRITPSGAVELPASQLDATCSDRVFDAERLVCVAFDGARTHLVAVEPSGGEPRAIGSLAGHFVSYRPTRAGWLSGWINSGTWIGASAWTDVGQVAIDAASGRALSVGPGVRADELTVVGNIAGTLARDASSARVRLYRLADR
jgi:Zn-dependent protease with chaperone function